MSDYDLFAAEEARVRGAPAGAPQENPYAADAANDAQQQDAVLRASINTALPVNPDQASKVKQLSDASGVPLPVVERNTDVVAQRQRAAEIYSTVAASPILRRQMTDPDFAKLAHDDVGNLSTLETIARTPWKLTQALASGPFALSGGLYGVGAVPFELLSQYVTGKGAPLERLLPVDVAGQIGAGMRGAAGNQAEAAKRIADVDPKSGVLVQGLASGMQSLGSNLPPMVAGFALRNPEMALSSMAAMTGGQSYVKGRDAGLSPSRATIYGANDAMIEYLTEKLPVERLLGDLHAGSPFLKTFLRNQVGEQLGEQAATVMQDFNEWATLHPEKPFSSYLAERPSAALQTAIATVVASGGQVALLKAADNASRTQADEVQRAQQAQQSAALLQRLSEVAQTSKVRERDPTGFANFLQSAAGDGGPIQNVFISAATLQQTLQDHGKTIDDMASVMPSVGEQFETALASGGDVQIPVGEYMAYTPGTGLDQALIQHLRTSEDGFTMAEAHAKMDALHQDLQNAVDKATVQGDFNAAWRESRASVESELLKQLNDANRFTSDVNQPYAKLASSFYAVQAARLGITPEQMYVKYPLQITQEDGVRAGDVDKNQQQGVSQSARTETPEFKSWFSGSKVVDAEGKPRVMYHGTGGDVTAFKPAVADAVFVSASPDIASGFASIRASDSNAGFGAPDGRANVVPLFVSAQNPFDYENKDNVKMVKDAIAKRHLKITTSDIASGNFTIIENPVIQDAIKALGFDSFYVNEGQDQPKNLGVYDPAKVKSAIGNKGTFDTNNPNILEQGGPRARLSLSRGPGDPAVLRLLEKADLSSFLHEMGHFQLEVLRDVAAQPNAPADIVKDYDALKKWFSSSNMATAYNDVKQYAAGNPEDENAQRALAYLNEKGGQAYMPHIAETFGADVPDDIRIYLVRPFHEQFARGFEAYLFEGKSPNQDMQGIFQRFRAWLVNVYTDVLSLRVKLTDEVRGVMDRLVATNEEIKQQEATRNLFPLFDTKPAGMTDEEWAAYRMLSDDSTQEAVEKLQTRSLRDMQWLSNAKGRELRRLQKAAEGKRAEVEAEVKAEVEAQPVYVAQRYLRTGAGTINGEEIQATVKEAHKLDSEAVKAMYPETALGNPDLSALHGMTTPGGLPPDVAAGLLGFTNGDAMVRALAAAPPVSEEVEGLTDQRMLERYGDLVDPSTIERAADEAVHNAARARFAATEYKMATKATGSVRQIMAAARDLASKSIARLKIGEIRPKQYAAAEARAATKAIETRSKPEEFAAASRDRMLNNALTREAYRAAEYVQKNLEYLRAVGDRSSIDIAYREQIDGLLERFDLRTSTPLSAAARSQSLIEWYENQTKQGLEPDIDPELLNEARRQPYRDMTLEQFKGLVDAVNNIEHLGRLKKKLLTAADQRDFDTAVSDLTATITDNAKNTLPQHRSSDSSLLTRTAALFRGAFAAHRKFASTVQEFDGFKMGGPAWEYLVRNMNHAGDTEATMNEQATLKLIDMLGPVVKGEGLRAARSFDFQGRQLSFTREERIGLLLNMGNETNLERVLTGERITPDQLRIIVGTLSTADLEFANKVWEYLDSFRPAMTEKQRRLTGTEPDWVSPESFQLETETGEKVDMRGGYYPIAYDPELSERSNADLNAEIANQIKGGLYTRAQTRRGHLKARADSTGRPLRYDFANVLTKHIGQVVHDLSWHEYLLDANRLLAAPAVESAVREHYGNEVLRNLKGTLTDVAVGGLTVPHALDSVFNHLRYGATIAGLGLNVSNTLINLVGLTQSMSKIGSKWVFKGLAHWTGDIFSAEKSVQKIYDMSEFMRLRGKTLNRELNEIRNKVGADNSKVTAAFFYLQNRTQVLVDVPTWWGGYEKAMAEENMTEKKAIALADQAVIDAQGSGHIKDLAGVQRGSAALKMFTSFYSFFSTTFNLTAEAYGRTDFKKPGEVALFAADMALLYTIPAIVGTLAKTALKWDWDDEDKLKKRLIADQLSYMLGTMVGVREVTAGVLEASGAGEGFGYTGPAGTRFFADVFTLGQQIKQGDPDAAFWKALNNTAGILFHYPSGQINRTLEGAYEMYQGHAQNPGALLVGPSKK